MRATGTLPLPKPRNSGTVSGNEDVAPPGDGAFLGNGDVAPPIAVSRIEMKWLNRSPRLLSIGLRTFNGSCRQFQAAQRRFHLSFSGESHT